jgi:formylglycine-generating enzyme required for sulfatase activity
VKKIVFLVSLLLILGLSAFVLPGDRIASQEADEAPEVAGMVFVPPGEFSMGSSLDDLRDMAEQDEFPQRAVWVHGFYIDVHEVTNAQYKVFVDSTGIEPPHLWEDGNYPVGRDGYPVVDVSWDDAVAYARFVGKRLPTEAEWEKAARGTDARNFPWGEKYNTHLINQESLQPVMSMPANRSPYGVFDMAGNAAEWVEDWYAAYPREAGEEIPKEVTTRRQQYPKEKYKVYRGGGFNTYGKYLRCANREREKPDKKWRYIGFRCAMDPPWQEDD